MKLKIASYAALVVSGLHLSHGAFAADLGCTYNGRGYEVHNFDTGRRVGTGHYFERHYCRTAISSLTYSSGRNLVCAPRPGGTGVFDADTGADIGSSRYFFRDVDTCHYALEHVYRGNVCVPYGSGSGLYNLRSGFYSNGYYYDVRNCSWAAWSSTQSRRFVCAPYGGGSAIFWRRSQERAYSTIYSDAETCAKSIPD